MSILLFWIFRNGLWLMASIEAELLAKLVACWHGSLWVIFDPMPYVCVPNQATRADHISTFMSTYIIASYVPWANVCPEFSSFICKLNICFSHLCAFTVSFIKLLSRVSWNLISNFLQPFHYETLIFSAHWQCTSHESFLSTMSFVLTSRSPEPLKRESIEHLSHLGEYHHRP